MFRRASSSDAAAKHPDVATAAKALAISIEALVNFRHHLGSGPEFAKNLREVAERATPILSSCVEPIRAEFERKPDHGKRKRELPRRALDELDRLRAGLEGRDSTPIQAAREAMSEIGDELLKLSAELEIAGDPDAAILRPAAHALHVANIEKSQEIGFREDTPCSSKCGLRPVDGTGRSLAEAVGIVLVASAPPARLPLNAGT
jgi:hypothetical protein